ncbi:IS66 family insertion sequence element accessory protein TnpA [Paraburkholderia sp. A1RO-5L]|uniref:IS66 family insertion sequence element accessory protein TnpA n=1 Tax=unclassified Paraburkholderia TaxID=2615204 RepID=UPI003B97E1F1
MQETERLSGDAAAHALPRRERPNRSTRPWQELVDEYRASGLSILAYCKRSGISRSSMSRYLVRAREAERSGDTHAASATGAIAQAMTGFVRVGIVDGGVNATANGSACDVPELILGNGIRLRLPVYSIEPLLQAMIDRIGGGTR